MPPARQHVLKATGLPASANAELGQCLCSTAEHAWPLQTNVKDVRIPRLCFDQLASKGSICSLLLVYVPGKLLQADGYLNSNSIPARP